MKTVDFRRTADKRSYFCMCGLVNSLCKINHEGIYVLASEVAERERKLLDALNAAMAVLTGRR